MNSTPQMHFDAFSKLDFSDQPVSQKEKLDILLKMMLDWEFIEKNMKEIESLSENNINFEQLIKLYNQETNHCSNLDLTSKPFKKKRRHFGSIDQKNFHEFFHNNKAQSRGSLIDLTKVKKPILPKIQKEISPDNRSPDIKLNEAFSKLLCIPALDMYQEAINEFQIKEKKSKKKLQIGKFINVFRKKYLYKIEEFENTFQEKELRNTKSTPELPSYSKVILNHKYTEIIKKFKHAIIDPISLKHITKLIKDIYNIEAPSLEEYCEIENYQIKNKEELENHYANVVKKYEEFGVRKQYEVKKKVKSSHNVSTIKERNSCVSDLSKQFNISNLNNSVISGSKKNNNSTIVSEDLIKDKNKQNSSLLQQKLIDNSIKKNEMRNKILLLSKKQYNQGNNLIEKYQNKFGKNETKFKNAFESAFSFRDIKMERDMSKQCVKNIKLNGEFIYGRSKGCFTGNKDLIFKRKEKQ